MVVKTLPGVEDKSGSRKILVEMARGGGPNGRSPRTGDGSREPLNGFHPEGAGALKALSEGAMPILLGNPVRPHASAAMASILGQMALKTSDRSARSMLSGAAWSGCNSRMMSARKRRKCVSSREVEPD